jgi:hypothetical protein
LHKGLFGEIIMKTYNFSAQGIDFGNYSGTDLAHAQDVFAQDAGYPSWSYMEEQAEEFGGNNVEIKEVL